MPVYVMVINGLKDKSYMTLSGHVEAAAATSMAAASRWPGMPSARTSGTSLRMVIPATIGSRSLGAVNGYLLSKWKFRGSDVIFTLILFGMFIPTRRSSFR